MLKTKVGALMDIMTSGVSTRKGRRITKELCGTESSRSTASDSVQAAGPCGQWRQPAVSCPGSHPFLLVDGLRIKVERAACYSTQSPSPRLAVRTGAKVFREVLGFMLGDSDHAPVVATSVPMDFWMSPLAPRFTSPPAKSSSSMVVPVPSRTTISSPGPVDRLAALVPCSLDLEEEPSTGCRGAVTGSQLLGSHSKPNGESNR